MASIPALKVSKSPLVGGHYGKSCYVSLVFRSTDVELKPGRVIAPGGEVFVSDGPGLIHQVVECLCQEARG